MRDRKNKFGLGQGVTLLIIGIVLIAIGLSFGGQWNAFRPWSRHNSESWSNESIQDVEELSGTIGSDIRKISIDLKAGSLDISVGDVPSYSAIDFSKDSISIEENSGSLKITEKNWKQRFGMNYPKSAIRIVLPKGTILELLDIDMGAGTVKGNDLMCKSVLLETGAGSIDFIDSSFEKTEIETGAGRVQFRGSLGRTTTISTGAGSVELNLEGTEDDYRIEFERGLGSVRIGAESWRGVGDGFAGRRGAEKEISISTGVGSVTIDFY